MKAVLAAAILALGMIASVLLYEHAENARLASRERKEACVKAKASLENCLSFFPPTADPIVRTRCRAAWDADIKESCYGIKAPPFADEEFFQ